MAASLTRDAVFLLGALLVGYVVLSYPHEEKSVLRWIESIQSSLAKIEAGTSARVHFFLRQILHAVVRIQAFIYGDVILSWRAMIVSLSLCSLLYLAWTLLTPKYWMFRCGLLGAAVIGLVLLRRRVPNYVALGIITIAGAFCMIARDFVPAFLQIHPYLLLPAVDFSPKVGLPHGYLEAMIDFNRVASAPFIILISTVVDYVSVFVTRRSFQRAEVAPGLLRCLLWISFATMVAPLTIVVLLGGTMLAQPILDHLFVDWIVVGFGTIRLSAVAILMSLGFIALLCLTVLGRSVLAITPRLVNSVVKVDLNSYRRVALVVR